MLREVGDDAWMFYYNSLALSKIWRLRWARCLTDHQNWWSECLVWLSPWLRLSNIVCSHCSGQLSPSAAALPTSRLQSHWGRTWGLWREWGVEGGNSTVSAYWGHLDRHAWYNLPPGDHIAAIIWPFSRSHDIVVCKTFINPAAITSLILHYTISR